MARIPDGFVLIIKVSGPKVKDGKAFADISIDEQELVMCKNCMHYDEEPDGDVMMCYRSLGYTGPNDYCSRGKRRDSE